MRCNKIVLILTYYHIIHRYKHRMERKGVTNTVIGQHCSCLLYTSDAADDLTRVDLGGRRIIKKKKK